MNPWVERLWVSVCPYSHIRHRSLVEKPVWRDGHYEDLLAGGRTVTLIGIFHALNGERNVVVGVRDVP